MPGVFVFRDTLRRTLDRLPAARPVRDMHTHLYPPALATPVPNATRAKPAGLRRWDVDELVTYHDLVAGIYRVVPATKLS